MTKTQVRSRLRKLLEKLGDARAELDDLMVEVEETRDEIEPYEYADDLTPEQEERQEWLDEVANAIYNAISNLEDIECDLDEYQW